MNHPVTIGTQLVSESNDADCVSFLSRNEALRIATHRHFEDSSRRCEVDPIEVVRHTQNLKSCLRHMTAFSDTFKEVSG